MLFLRDWTITGLSHSNEAMRLTVYEEVMIRFERFDLPEEWSQVSSLIK